MSYTLRLLVTADAAEVAALIRAAFAALSAPVEPQPSALRVTVETVAAAIDAGGGAGAVGGEALVGAVLWEERPTGLYMGRLSVRPGWRGQGIARALVAEAEAEARRRELPALLLATRLAFVDNRRLFAACGFRETTLHSHPGYAEPTFVDMEKPLV